MSIETCHGHSLYFISTDGPSLCSEQDALDLLGEIWGTAADFLVVPVNGGVKTGHGAEQKSATLDAGMRPAGGRSPSGGLIPA
ncbi:hypothetical protein [Martelella soudanensis]|uniref:hypothetical protein n=1 Tax=Martelella sp. NC20 TaxID=2740298 RepID=UPI0015DF625E|nr:hypothetical protein [Martelella sp. NC20]